MKPLTPFLSSIIISIIINLTCYLKYKHQGTLSVVYALLDLLPTTLIILTIGTIVTILMFIFKKADNKKKIKRK